MTKDNSSNIYSFDGIRDGDLHAYIDGCLDPQRKKEVEAYLEHHPDAAEKYRDYAAYNTLLRAAYEDIAAQPVPHRLTAALHKKPAAPRRAFYMRVAAVAVFCLLSATGGWLAAKHSGNTAEDVKTKAVITAAAPVEKIPVDYIMPPVQEDTAQAIDISTGDNTGEQTMPVMINPPLPQMPRTNQAPLQPAVQQPDNNMPPHSNAAPVEIPQTVPALLPDTGEPSASF